LRICYKIGTGNKRKEEIHMCKNNYWECGVLNEKVKEKINVKKLKNFLIFGERFRLGIVNIKKQQLI